MYRFRLPETHRALILSSTQPEIDAKVHTVPVPQPTPSSVPIKVILARVLPYAKDVYDGYSAIGRAVAVGSDAVKIAPGQLVLADNYIRGRDVADVSFLAGLHEEYTKVPLENCFPLDEERLLGKVENGGLGYRMEDLPYFTLPPVPYGGLVDIALLTGETIIIALATGTLGVAHFLRMSTSTSVQLSMTTCKAELTRLSETLRLETPFGVNVLTVVTGAVGSNFFVNTPEYKLPSTSRYKPIETRIATWQGVRTISLG